VVDPIHGKAGSPPLKGYKTTQRDINIGRQFNPTAQNLFAPDLGRATKAVEG
jgi:hypothetical protein